MWLYGSPVRRQSWQFLTVLKRKPGLSDSAIQGGAQEFHWVTFVTRLPRRSHLVWAGNLDKPIRKGLLKPIRNSTVTEAENVRQKPWQHLEQFGSLQIVNVGFVRSAVFLQALGWIWRRPFPCSPMLENEMRFLFLTTESVLTDLILCSSVLAATL